MSARQTDSRVRATCWSVVRASKGCLARVLRVEFPYLRRLANVLWSPSYFAAPFWYVSESAARPYVEHQWDAVA